MLTSAPYDLLNQVGWLLGPHERVRVVVPSLDIAPNMRHQRANRVKRSATHGFARQDTEPDFHEVEPRGACRREMKMDPRVGLHPGTNRRGRVRRRVVENDVQIPARIASVQDLQEVEKLDGRVPWLAGA